MRLSKRLHGVLRGIGLSCRLTETSAHEGNSVYDHSTLYTRYLVKQGFIREGIGDIILRYFMTPEGWEEIGDPERAAALRQSETIERLGIRNFSNAELSWRGRAWRFNNPGTPSAE
jgi:hypothetical protein